MVAGPLRALRRDPDVNDIFEHPYAPWPVSGQAQPTAEAREVAWMITGEVEAAMTPAFAVRVLDAIDGQVHTRTHDGINLL